MPRYAVVGRLALLLPALLVVLASPAQGPTFASSSEEQAVLDELRAYYADFTARDWKKFASHFWPGATLTTVWQPAGEAAPHVVTTSVPEFLAQTADGPDSKPIFEERMTGAETKVYGNLAQVWAHYYAKFGDSNRVDKWSGIDAFTLMKHDGRWKITSLAYTGVEADPAAGETVP